MDEIRPASLKDNIHTILNGTRDAKDKLQGRFFHIADTPQFMKELGLSGDYFEIKYGVIVRHYNKDADHALTEQTWKDLSTSITRPFAISESETGFKLFTNVKENGKDVVVGVEVKKTSQDLEVNAVTTAFGYRPRPIKNVIYVSKEITPEQAALLDKPDALSLPPVQGATLLSPQPAEKSSGSALPSPHNATQVLV
jgi:hypothetical protein